MPFFIENNIEDDGKTSIQEHKVDTGIKSPERAKKPNLNQQIREDAAQLASLLDVLVRMDFATQNLQEQRDNSDISQIGSLK